MSCLRPSRADALALVHEYVTNVSLINHMKAVEAAVRAYAKKLSQDEELWGLAGLLHDFDYERWPQPPDHPLKGSEILRQRGYPEEVIYAILAHADYLTEYPRTHLLDKALYACDELAGFIVAVALMRPGGVMDLNASSVLKKLKRREFARNVNREDIRKGAEDFGVDLTEHIQFVIEALRPIAAEIGIERGSQGVTDV
jgi:putative nucleotidyltransferase with HDIG domain